MCIRIYYLVLQYYSVYSKYSTVLVKVHLPTDANKILLFLNTVTSSVGNMAKRYDSERIARILEYNEP